MTEKLSEQAKGVYINSATPFDDTDANSNAELLQVFGTDLSKRAAA